MADHYQLESGAGNYQLEDGSGSYLLETGPPSYSVRFQTAIQDSTQQQAVFPLAFPGAGLLPNPTKVIPLAPEYITGTHSQAVSDSQTASSQQLFRPVIIPSVAGNPFQFILTVQMTWEQNASVTFEPFYGTSQMVAHAVGSLPQDPQWQQIPSVVFAPFRGASRVVARTVLSAQEARDLSVRSAVFSPIQVPAVTIGPFLTTLLSSQDPLPLDAQIAASQAVFNAAAFSIPIPPPPPVVTTPSAGGTVPGHTGGKRKRRKDGPYMRDDQVFGEEYAPSPLLNARKGLKSAGKRVQVPTDARPDHRDAIRILLRELL